MHILNGLNVSDLISDIQPEAMIHPEYSDILRHVSLRRLDERLILKFNIQILRFVCVCVCVCVWNAEQVKTSCCG